MILDGWILDVYPVSGGMCVWMVDEDGRSQALLDPWTPSFYLPADKPLPPKIIAGRIVEKKDFFSGLTIPVREIRVSSPLLYASITNRLMTVPDLALFNADLNLGQLYFYERNL